MSERTKKAVIIIGVIIMLLIGTFGCNTKSGVLTNKRINPAHNDTTYDTLVVNNINIYLTNLIPVDTAWLFEIQDKEYKVDKETYFKYEVGDKVKINTNYTKNKK